MNPKAKIVLLGGTPKTSFELALKTSLVPEKAVSGTATFTRSSTKTVIDFEGLSKTCKAGEIPETGARRVENLTPQSEWDSTWVAAGTTPPTVNNADVFLGKNCVSVTFPSGVSGYGTSRGTSGFFGASTTKSYVYRAQVALSRELTGSEDIQCYMVSAGGFLVSVNNRLPSANVWYKRAQVALTPAGNIAWVIYPTSTLLSPLTVYLTERQHEEVSGQANQNPSEYVSNAVLSVPYHGAGVDGVKYFPYQNGNTVVGHVITEAQGAPIAEATLKGGLIEAARTNLALQSQTLATTWSATNITVATDSVVSPDGTTTAETLTASADNATLLQTITSSVADRVFSIWLKRKTGTGNIDLTVDNGSTWTTKTITSSWVRYNITQAAVTNPVIGIRIATNADAIYAWGGQLESANFASSYIPTTTASVTRAADVLSYPVDSNLNANSGAVYLEFTPAHAPSGTVYLFGSYVDASNYTAILHDGTNLIARKRIAGTNYDATTTNAFVANTTYKIAASWGSSGLNIVLGGVLGTPNSNSLNLQLGSTFQIGADGNGGQQPFASIKNIKFYQKALPTPKLVSLTR